MVLAPTPVAIDQMNTVTAVTSGAAAATGQPCSGATLLLVDDEPSVLSALRRLFRMQGYQVRQASSGAEGLAMLGEQPADLVISDMRMPEMDGARFLEHVRNSWPETARILLTGYADIGSTIAAINRGEVHRYVAKPWDDQDLLLIVRDALQRRALERQNAELLELTQQQNAQLSEANRTLEARVAARTAELQQVNDMLEAAYGDLDQTFTLAVNVFSGLLEMREGVAGHSRRVADLAGEVARRLGLAERDVRDVRLGALLHDVGKIGFPDRMLGRPMSAYTGDEVTRYRRHPIDGETALMPLTQLRGAARIVRQHHERSDGKGFPDGLAGEQIAIGARIVGALSDYDDMVQGLAAQTRHSPERAQQLLRGGVGTHYDATVVEALLAAIARLHAGDAGRRDPAAAAGVESRAGGRAGQALRRLRADNRPMRPPLAQPLIDHRDEIARLCLAHGVERLEVFGSAADGRFDPQRSDFDFDFIVTFSPAARKAISDHYFALADELESLLGRKVDLLTDQPIRNPFLRRAVDASRRDIDVRAAAEAS
jgi:putative nucleotidyltransferase with HDIG domain